MSYLFAAYVAIWCLLFFYLFSIRSRQKSLERTIEALMKKTENLP